LSIYKNASIFQVLLKFLRRLHSRRRIGLEFRRKTRETASKKLENRQYLQKFTWQNSSIMIKLSYAR